VVCQWSVLDLEIKIRSKSGGNVKYFLAFFFIVFSGIINPALCSNVTLSNTDPFRALYLWTEKERQRAEEDARYRYYDYWAYRNRLLPDYYNAYIFWLNMEQTRRWLEDPDKHPLPPPPPVPPYSLWYYPMPAPGWMPYVPPPYTFPYWGSPYQYPYPYGRGRGHVHKKAKEKHR